MKLTMPYTWEEAELTPEGDLYTLELEVEYDYTPGVPARLGGPPEDCYPPESAQVEVEAVHIISITHAESGEQLGDVSEAMCERWMKVFAVEVLCTEAFEEELLTYALQADESAREAAEEDRHEAWRKGEDR